MTLTRPNVRYWHKADIGLWPHMSAIGTKGTSLVALHMSAFTQSGHRASLNDPHLNRYDALS